MSSESNDHKPDSLEPGPTSSTSTRLSARAPSAWGAARDALAAVHNLDALLRSTSVLYRTIRDLLPELRTSADVLRDAFERARSSEGAVADVGEYGVDRAAELASLLDATAIADEERDDLADRARTLADELEATADLLALLERASDPVAHRRERRPGRARGAAPLGQRAGARDRRPLRRGCAGLHGARRPAPRRALSFRSLVALRPRRGMRGRRRARAMHGGGGRLHAGGGRSRGWCASDGRDARPSVGATDGRGRAMRRGADRSDARAVGPARIAASSRAPPAEARCPERPALDSAGP